MKNLKQNIAYLKFSLLTLDYLETFFEDSKEFHPIMTKEDWLLAIKSSRMILTEYLGAFERGTGIRKDMKNAEIIMSNIRLSVIRFQLDTGVNIT